jgi:hypothetical protein
VVALVFAGWFTVTTGWALLYALDHRSHAGEPYPVPVELPAALLTYAGDRTYVHIRYLHKEAAYALCGQAPPADGTAQVDLTAVGIHRMPSVAISRAPHLDGGAGAGTCLRLSLKELTPEERDAIDRHLFETAFPAVLARLHGAPHAPAPAEPETNPALSNTAGVHHAPPGVR